MKCNNFLFSICLLLVIILFSGNKILAKAYGKENVAFNKPVVASSEAVNYPARNAVNGIISREEKWMSLPEALPPHILEIDLQKYHHIDRIVMHSGIPEEERSLEESLQAAGFWSVKQFMFQYWDDANWTDIPGTETTENRETSVVMDFSPGFTTFKIRFVAMDGEPIHVMEIEVFGEEVAGMPVPTPFASDVSFDKNIAPEGFLNATIHVSPETNGKSMQYVAYNQAYYLPGTNVSGWLEYAGVNSLRVWTSLGSYVPVSTVQSDAPVSGLDEFERRKSELRANPENNRFIAWDELMNIFSSADTSSTNAMVFDYALKETKRLGIDVILQINERRFDDDWTHKWQQWQRFYALAYHAAKKGDVGMFSIQNEPNHRHSGPMRIEEWLVGMRIASDAIRCAVEDVNRLYSKNLHPQFVGPVTAGTNVDWWAEVVKNVRIDYRGQNVDHDLIDLFSTHSYNSPAAGYSNRVQGIREVIRNNHPAGNEIPVVYTETGRWMNAYLIDKEETMDSPSLFTEWAGMYTNNMLNGAYGMWAFKLASNTSPTYPRGIKSGHHFVWNGQRIVEDAYENIAMNKQVVAFESRPGSKPGHVTDGDLSDHSSWFSDSDDPKKWLTIDLGKEETIGSAITYTGSSYGVFTGPDRVRNFKLQYRKGNEWLDIPGASETDCKYVQVLHVFDEPVSTREVRFVALEEGSVKVREIKLFRHNEGPDIAPVSYDISGVHRTGEVVRLFAKGFKEQRDLLHTSVSMNHSGLDAVTSFDPLTGNHYMWLVQRALFDYHLDVDLSEMNIFEGRPVIAELVGPDHYGEVVEYTHADHNGTIDLKLPAQSVMLLTVPAVEAGVRMMIHPASDATVRGGKYANKNFGRKKTMVVSLDASKPANNQVSYIHFDLSAIENNENSLTLLGLNGYVDDGDEPIRVHVYGFPTETWGERAITWSKAPNLDANEALIRNVGQDVFIAGQLAFDNEKSYRYLDVTRHVKSHPNGITFVVVRETRHMGDYGDKGRKVLIHSRESKLKPVLIHYSDDR